MNSGHSEMRRSTERAAQTFNGYFFLIGLPILWFLSYLVVANALPGLEYGKAGKLTFIFTLVGVVIANTIFTTGFFMVQPNETRVITLFGKYVGTERSDGLRWIWPWMSKKKVSVRAHNVHSERVKINDLRGNPVDIACNVVWRVRDTAQAVFDIDDYSEFVNIQIEAGLRTVGARHPYDDMSEDDQTTLRGSADVINSELQAELNDRLAVSGIVVDEAGLTHLAYAQEIAGAMLRRQQAEAIIAARTKIVMGAVSMVEDALEKLGKDGIVELDDERRAAMVSNLMVVLCGDREAQPIVNAGTLYQ